MASTSVHLPPSLVEKLDRLAAERGTSRNRIILQACEDLLKEQRGDWPGGFFEAIHSPEDQAMLREAGVEMESAIYAARRDRPVVSL